MPHANWWQGWQNQTWIGTTSATTAYPYASPLVYAQPALPAVLESPAATLDDREWLDAQIAEVCELATAA